MTATRKLLSDRSSKSLQSQSLPHHTTISTTMNIVHHLFLLLLIHIMLFSSPSSYQVSARSTRFPTYAPTMMHVDVLQDVQIFNVTSSSSYRVKLPNDDRVQGIFVYMWGAGGGSCGSSQGGGGAYIEGFLPLQKEDQIVIIVGQAGTSCEVRQMQSQNHHPSEIIGGGGHGGCGYDHSSEDEETRVLICGGSGGGRSAIQYFGEDIVTAGGGGGAGLRHAITSGSNLMPSNGGSATITQDSRQGDTGMISTDCSSSGGGGGGNEQRPGCGMTAGGKYYGGNATSVGAGGGGGGYYGGGAGQQFLAGGAGSSLSKNLQDNDQSENGNFPGDRCAGTYALPSSEIYPFNADQQCGASNQHGLVYIEIVYLPATDAPTATPTLRPTTISPTKQPTISPTRLPTLTPSVVPSLLPTALPTYQPTQNPTTLPPSAAPSVEAVVPIDTPTLAPSIPESHDTQSSSPSPSPTMQPWAWWYPTVGSPTFQPFRDGTVYTSYPTIYSGGYTNDDVSDNNKDTDSTSSAPGGFDWLDSDCSNHDIMLVALMSSACTIFVTMLIFFCCGKLCPSAYNRNLYASSSMGGGSYERVGYDDLDTRAYEMPRRNRRF